MDEKVRVIVKTPKMLENVTAMRIKEVTGCKTIPKPEGMQGLVLVICDKEPEEVAKTILENIPEAEKVLPVYLTTKADLDSICEESKRLAKKYLNMDETFAVRTTRRGKHDFTSLDVNVRAGACIQEATNSPVDLEHPDKIFWVEIIKDKAYISVTKGNIIYKKTYPGKPDATRFLRKIVIAQMPYLGDYKGARKIGVRLGRVLQTFEVNEFYVTPHKPAPADELNVFLDGLLEGRKSRYDIQRRTYSREVHRVPVYVYDLYQYVRNAKGKGEPIIVTSTKGKYIGEVRKELKEIFEKNKKVHILIGSREGIPTGIYRFADLVIDIMPGITLATDVAMGAILTAIVNVLTETSNA